MIARIGFSSPRETPYTHHNRQGFRIPDPRRFPSPNSFVFNSQCLVCRHLNISIKMLFFRLRCRFFDIFALPFLASALCDSDTLSLHDHLCLFHLLLNLLQIGFLSLMIHPLELWELAVKLTVALTVDLIVMPDANFVLVCVPILHKISPRDVSSPINSRNIRHHDHRSNTLICLCLRYHRSQLPRNSNTRCTEHAIPSLVFHHSRNSRSFLHTIWREKDRSTRSLVMSHINTAPHPLVSASHCIVLTDWSEMH